MENEHQVLFFVLLIISIFLAVLIFSILLVVLVISQHNQEDAQHNQEEADAQHNQEEADAQYNQVEADDQHNQEEADDQHNQEEADDQHNQEEANDQHNNNGNLLPHHHHEQQEDDEHGNMPHQQHQEPLQDLGQQPMIRYDDMIDYMPHNFWPVALHQDQGLGHQLQQHNDIIHENHGNIPDGQPHQQDQEPVQGLGQLPILQDDDIIHDDNGHLPNGQPHQQDQEPVQGLGQLPILQDDDIIHDDNGHLPNGQPHQQDQEPPHIRFFEIWHCLWPQHEQAVQEGDHIPQQVLPTFVLHVPQWPASFVVARRFGVAVIVNMIHLYLCNNFDDFRAGLGQSYEQAVGEALNNPTVENPIPGCLLAYYLAEPQEEVLDLNGIPWQDFRTRLALVYAFEL